MLYFILAVLALAAVAGFLLLWLSRSEVKHMAEELRKINGSKTVAFVRLSRPNRRLERLAVEINRTIAQKQRAEAQYQRMEQERRESIANISHDLRTPLTSVIGYLQLLDDEALPENERRRYQEIVRSRAKDLSLLVAGLFDLSRLQAGEYGFELTSVSLPNILCEMAASFYPEFTARGIEPSLDIENTAPPVVADENAVRRVFSNLIHNALKYSGGSIRIVLKMDGGYIVTSFTNDAPQLTEEDTQRLFERFYTAERMRSGRNTGLGLAITRQLVEKMGGEIDAYLAEGKLTIRIRWKLPA